jgi:CRP-like cAMP-binding protein
MALVDINWRESNFYRYYKEKAELSDEVFEQLAPYFSFREVPHNHYLLRAGELSHYAFFVESGLLESFYLYQGDRTIGNCFYTTGIYGKGVALKPRFCLLYGKLFTAEYLYTTTADKLIIGHERKETLSAIYGYVPESAAAGASMDDRFLSRHNAGEP